MPCPPATTRTPLAPNPKAGPPGGISHRLLGGSQPTLALRGLILEHQGHIPEDQQDMDRILEDHQRHTLAQDNHPGALDLSPLIHTECQLLQ